MMRIDSDALETPLTASAFERPKERLDRRGWGEPKQKGKELHVYIPCIQLRQPATHF